jgi:hypothetical protein
MSLRRGMLTAKDALFDGSVPLNVVRLQPSSTLNAVSVATSASPPMPFPL